MNGRCSPRSFHTFDLEKFEQIVDDDIKKFVNFCEAQGLKVEDCFPPE